jgi:hypothetical protein
MKKSRQIIWIDDDPRRQRTADDLGATFIDVRDEDVAKKAETILQGSEPALVIVDHILDKANPKARLFQRGSTIAEAIKEQWPSCPVVGVTNVDNVEEIDLRTQGIYDALFSFQEFRSYFNRIDSIRNGFALIARTSLTSAHRLIRLLRPPIEEVDRLLAALPNDLKKAFGDASLPSRLHRWVNGLMDRPGFLYDSLWAATTIGLTETGFKKVVGLFKDGEYRGVFQRIDEPRWWSKGISEILYAQHKPEMGEMSWHVGRRLQGITRDHYSHCYKCGKPFPETVAYLDKASVERQAMHLDCTILHPRYQRELYFEDVRMMQG